MQVLSEAPPYLYLLQDSTVFNIAYVLPFPHIVGLPTLLRTVQSGQLQGPCDGAGYLGF